MGAISKDEILEISEELNHNMTEEEANEII